MSWLTDWLGTGGSVVVLTDYMGEEWTDEPVFEVLAGQAITVRVGVDARMSRAACRVPGVDEVHRLLSALARGVMPQGAA